MMSEFNQFHKQNVREVKSKEFEENLKKFYDSNHDEKVFVDLLYPEIVRTIKIIIGKKFTVYGLSSYDINEIWTNLLGNIYIKIVDETFIKRFRDGYFTEDNKQLKPYIYFMIKNDLLEFINKDRIREDKFQPFTTITNDADENFDIGHLDGLNNDEIDINYSVDPYKLYKEEIRKIIKNEEFKILLSSSYRFMKKNDEILSDKEKQILLNIIKLMENFKQLPEKTIHNSKLLLCKVSQCTTNDLDKMLNNIVIESKDLIKKNNRRHSTLGYSVKNKG